MPSDLAEFQSDTTTLSRNNAWIKDLSKDIYLKEAVDTISLMNDINKKIKNSVTNNEIINHLMPDNYKLFSEIPPVSTPDRRRKSYRT